MPTPPPARVLVAEDQADIRDLVVLNLGAAGYAVTAVADGAAALAHEAASPSDLLLLDWMMPGVDGLEVCKTLRMQGRSTPILMLTARSTELDRVLGLELGADDYLTKPFSVAELLARVKALLRREQMLRQAARDAGSEQRPITVGALQVWAAKRRVTLDGGPIELTAREFDLLLHFASHPGHVYSRAQLLDAVWGFRHEGYEHTVTTHINRLRAKLEADPLHPEWILTVRGAGYKLRD